MPIQSKRLNLALRVSAAGQITGSLQSELKQSMPCVAAQVVRALFSAIRVVLSAIPKGNSSNGSFKSSTVEIFSRFSARLFIPNFASRNLYTRIRFYLYRLSSSFRSFSFRVSCPGYIEFCRQPHYVRYRGSLSTGQCIC